LNNYIFIPIGSYEQHGPHLPPDTDYLIAKKLVDIVSHIFNGSVIEGIKIGISPEHEGFKNTKSLSQKEFITQIETIIANYQSNSKIIIINAHGGNVVALNSTNKLKKKYILLLHTFSLIKNELTQIRTSDIGGICHAGEFETSIMLYIYPDKVNMNNLKKRDVKYVPTLDPNYDKEKLKNWKTSDLSKSGILGDPFHATTKKGEIWFNYLIKQICYLTRNFITEV
jgi:creatinine amidohydrolase